MDRKACFILLIVIHLLLNFNTIIEGKPCGVRWNKCPKSGTRVRKNRVVRQIYDDKTYEDIITSIEDELKDEINIIEKKIKQIRSFKKHMKTGG